MDVVIQPVRSDADLDAASQLIREYVDWLGIDLSFQNFDVEIADLSAKYAPPTGELFLARGEDGQFLGCAGVTSYRRPGACELKRLYVRDAARGTGTGRALAAAAVAAAVALGYREMLLDTLSTMSSAIWTLPSPGVRDHTALLRQPRPRGGVLRQASVPVTATAPHPPWCRFCTDPI